LLLVTSTLLVFHFSCASAPGNAELPLEAVPAGNQTSKIEAPIVIDHEPERITVPEDNPIVVTLPEFPVQEVEVPLDEPAFDLPETVIPPDASGFEEALVALSVPLAPALPLVVLPTAPPAVEAPIPPPAAVETPSVPLVQQPAVPSAPSEPVETPRQSPPETPVLRPLEQSIMPLPMEEPVSPPVTTLPQGFPDLPVRTPPSAAVEEIVFSRIVRATIGQLVEIPFRGAGWVYLGELSSRRGIAYDSRRLDPEGQTFVFRAEQAGTYALKFYRQDFIREYILNDYVQVIVDEAPDASGAGWFSPPVDRGRVTAEPRWPPAEDAAQPSAVTPGFPAASAEQPSASSPVSGTSSLGTETAAATAGVLPPAETVLSPSAAPAAAVPPGVPLAVAEAPPADVPPTDTAVPPLSEIPADVDPGEYIQNAKNEYDAGRVTSALAILNRLQELYPSGTDEAWWLCAQLLEANGPNRDIRLALEYYRRLIREYPQSLRVLEARQRIAYLERFYFNLR
jgi:tetratricopeptide (TPR) repeat protein